MNIAFHLAIKVVVILSKNRLNSKPNRLKYEVYIYVIYQDEL